MRPNVKKNLRTNKKVLKKRAPRRITVPIAIKQYVNRMNARGEETKQQNFSERTSLLPYNAVTTTLKTLDFNSVVGLVSQGTGEGNRIGNKIKVTEMGIKGWISISDAFAATGYTGTVIVKMFIGRLKQTLNNPNVTTLYTRLYDNGNTSISPQNDYFDVLRTPNKDIFMIYKTKSFKLAPSQQRTTGGTTVYNNDFKALCPFSINVNKHVNNLTFDDNNTTPSNQAIYIWFVCVNADGSPTNALMPPQINLCYDMVVKYKDA